MNAGTISLPLAPFNMHRHPKNYLRALRKQWPLTQDELALLLGLSSQGTISRYERVGGLPTSLALIRLEIIFEGKLRGLYPKAFSDAEMFIIRRARMLLRELEDQNSETAALKRKLLADLISRIESSSLHA